MIERLWRRRPSLTVTWVALWLAACGGAGSGQAPSGASSEGEAAVSGSVVAEVERVCARLQEEGRAVSGFESTDPKDTDKAFRQIAALQERAVDELRGIQAGSELDTAIALSERTLSLLMKGPAVVRQQDPAAAARWQRQLDSAGLQLSEELRSIGADACL